MREEPVFTIAGISAAVAALITLLTAFGLALTHEQTEAILGFTAIVTPLVAAYFQRRRVTPVRRQSTGGAAPPR